jgi:hypothetical protein
VKFDLTAYEDATAVLREDLFRMKEIAKGAAPIGEERQVETALNTLENKLGNMKKMFTKGRSKERIN